MTRRSRRSNAPAAPGKKTSATAPRPANRARIWGAAIVGLCLLAYLAPGQSQPGNDATSNVHLALRLLEHGSLYFTVEDNPRMFFFTGGPPEAKKTVRFRDWQQTYQNQTARQAYAQGLVQVNEPIYYIVPTRFPGKYANTFGIGAGLFALPIVAPVRVLVPDLASRLDLLWWLAKLAAALSVAGAVAFVYFAALRHVSVQSAAVIALAYGLATCAFSISSQALWQHGPCELFLAMGAYFLLGKADERSSLLSGLGFALAVLCRPTSGLVVVCVGVHLLITNRRRLSWFVLGGLPVALVLLVYSQVTFGSLFSFGQLGVGASVALFKTGRPELWQTPLAKGLAGLLFSPARGLFIYTPVALFAVWGAGRAFRDPAWKDLRPLAVAALLVLGLAAKWFDWWGGWCFGYRPIVDLVILLAFLSFPVANAVAASKARKTVFVGLFAYSFGVQVLGAFVYDVGGWNGRIVWQVTQPGTTEAVTFHSRASALRFFRERGGKPEVQELNIDLPEYRHRLWSITDSPLVYYFANFSTARHSREKNIVDFLAEHG
jgi:hypothetical protein